MDKQEEIKRLLSPRLRAALEKRKPDYKRLQEIRLRIGCPVALFYENKEVLLEKEDTVTKQELKETVELMCSYSFYAFEEEIKQGFLTLPGGHRVGVAGRVIVEGGRVKNIKNISCINLRLAHEIKGCAKSLLPKLWEPQKNQWLSTLIVSPPGCGKTTLLRDMIRLVSGKATECSMQGVNVGVVDERSELGACYLGIPQNDLGIRTDILDGCPKAEGMMMLIRSMSPRVLAVDEIGGEKDKEALGQALNCGCAVFATAHGTTLSDIEKRGLSSFFERFVLLKPVGRAGEIEGIYERGGKKLW